MSEVVHNLTRLTERFAMEIIGLPIPSPPARLDDGRKYWAVSALTEEISEFVDATTLEEEADALIDLAYFALGRIVEMGLAPTALFEEVHAANMKKVRGQLSKRPNSKGYDATKPADWTPPFLAGLITANLEDVLFANQIRALHDAEPVEIGNWPFDPPKVLILGHGRHGKDEAAAILAKTYNLRHTSSSQFCAERVILPAIKQMGILNSEFPFYANAEACFNDRANHRAAWFNLIKAFNIPDATALGKAIFEEHDIYVGLRNAAEFHALKNAGIYDLCIWIDRSEHVPAEDKSSCTVEPWMADFVVDNNGSLEDLEQNILSFMDGYLTAMGEDK